MLAYSRGSQGKHTEMWEKRVIHKGLNAYRVIRGATDEEVETKARLQMAAWAERWERKMQAERDRQARASKRLELGRKTDLEARFKAVALERTREAEAAIQGLKTILLEALNNKAPFDWEALRDTTQFSEPTPAAPELKPLPAEPRRDQPEFAVAPFWIPLTLFDQIIPARKKKKQLAQTQEQKRRTNEADQRFSQAHAEWEAQCRQLNEENLLALARYNKDKADWQTKKKDFERIQKAYNLSVEELHEQYLARSPQALTRYFTEVLAQSRYPDSFPRDCSVAYEPSTHMLVVDHELPSQRALPSVKEVKYVAARQEFQEARISEAESKRLYDDLLYQICLRTLHEIFSSDDLGTVTNVVFNGWVHSIDKATGTETHPCVMSIQVNKDDFLKLNLSQVDLKTCFRSLKGISGSRLVDLSPVRPVLTLNKDDPRFVSAYGVASSLDERTNLAAMDWLDFENLIRELFEKEFSRNGGEVKITRASRDGGVDAVAFDPDPIRGGKIVIQAKRYTNAVGVSAVRDLFGTVHNEGATKGILVTTSDYGPDAYEFAKGKPLTLLSGSELLYLLQKHGYHAKIDIKEAKKLLGETE